VALIAPESLALIRPEWVALIGPEYSIITSKTKPYGKIITFFQITSIISGECWGLSNICMDLSRVGKKYSRMIISV